MGHTPGLAPFEDSLVHSVCGCGGLITECFRSQHRRRQERGLIETSSLLEGLHGLSSQSVAQISLEMVI